MVYEITTWERSVDGCEHDPQPIQNNAYTAICEKCGALEQRVELDTIYQGDAWELAEWLPDSSINCIVTSPPYWGLRDYGDEGQFGLEPTPEEYIAKLVDLFRRLWPKLRDDGSVWLNLGDSYAGSGKGRNSDGSHQEGGKQGTNRRTIEGRLTKTYSDDNLKPKDLVGIPWRTALALQADGWYLRSDIIWHKCLAHSTRVYAKTQKGEMPMTVGEMARLKPETVNLWTGQKWAQVKAIEKTTQTEGIEITFRNGQRVSCTPEHKWVLNDWQIIEAQNLTIGDKLQSTRLPQMAEPIDPLHLPPITIGWFVGLYLAEGSRGKHGDVIQIAGHKDELERFNKLSSIAIKFGGTCRQHNTGGNAATINIYSKVLRGILDTYINGQTAKTKHLSTACWQRNNEFLDALLNGYLEGDGHHDKDHKRYRLGFTRNDALADDLRTICARLGYSCRLRRAWHTNQSGRFYGWRGSITEYKNRRTEDWEIVGLQRSKSNAFYDIEIDDPHVFALSSGLLTHNSNPMPESVTDRPTKAHEYVFLLSKSARYFYDNEAVKEPAQPATLERNKYGWTGAFKGQFRGTPNEQRWQNGRPIDKANFGTHGRNRRSVWTIATRPYSGAHFAVFPAQLIEPCILAGCPEKVCAECGAPWERVVEKIGTSLPVEERHGRTGHNGQPPQISGNYWTGPTTAATNDFIPTCDCNRSPRPGVVLDPFMGSGTTGEVAIKHRRQWIGFELNPEYIKLAHKRLSAVQVRLI